MFHNLYFCSLICLLTRSFAQVFIWCSLGKLQKKGKTGEPLHREEKGGRKARFSVKPIFFYEFLFWYIVVIWNRNKKIEIEGSFTGKIESTIIAKELSSIEGEGERNKENKMGTNIKSWSRW